MSSEVTQAVRAMGLAKHYRLYEKPHHRLWQTLYAGRRNFFREFRALHDVSFELAKGDTLGVIGRNGAGKSTLLGLICGTIAPTLGSIEVQGRVAALLELGTGFNPEFTGRQNVAINASILGLSAPQLADRLDDILGFADIGDFIDQPVKTYSSGMYVRLAFSVVVHVSPDILIVDEALAVGDSLFQAKCMTRMRRMLDNGLTLLFTSHDITAVKAMCRKALWLESGRVRQFGDTSSVASAYFYDWVREANAIQGAPVHLAEPERLATSAASADPDAPAHSAHPASDAAALAVTAPLPHPYPHPHPHPAPPSPGTPIEALEGAIPLERSGTGAVRLQRMGWSTEGAPTTQAHARYGDTLTIVATLAVQAPCTRLVVSFHIKNRQAQFVFGGHTADRADIFDRAWAPGETAQIRFKAPVLLHEGPYSLTMLVTSIGDKVRYTDAVFHDWVEDVAMMNVAPRAEFPLSDLVEMTPQVSVVFGPPAGAVQEATS